MPKSRGFTPIKSGFTLVELLVVIAIIAVLAVIGVAVFSGVTKSARDSKRMADINALANAFEVHNNDSSCPITGSGYCFSNQNPTDATWQAYAASWFTNGQIPIDPVYSGPTAPTGLANLKDGCGSVSADAYTSKCWYCLKAGLTAGYCSGPDAYIPGNLNSVWKTTIRTEWMICANLETGTNKYYCKRNLQ